MECPQVFYFWVLMFVSQLWVYGCFGCFEKERSSLLELKFSINHPNGTSLPSWRAGTDCCSWEGVGCNFSTGRVILLELPNSRDRMLGDWYLNASLLSPFEELKNLYLSNNLLSGFLDEEGLSPSLSLPLICMTRLLGPLDGCRPVLDD